MADSSRIEDLRRRVQKDPASIAFAQLAEECRRAGNVEEAVSVAKAGLALHPTYLSARVTLGRSLLELNQLDDAQTELQQVLRSAPENLAALRALAETLRRLGDAAKALTQYRAALALAKNDPDLQDAVAALEDEVAMAVVPEPVAAPAATFSYAEPDPVPPAASVQAPSAFSYADPDPIEPAPPAPAPSAFSYADPDPIDLAPPAPAPSAFSYADPEPEPPAASLHAVEPESPTDDVSYDAALDVAAPDPTLTLSADFFSHQSPVVSPQSLSDSHQSSVISHQSLVDSHQSSVISPEPDVAFEVSPEAEVVEPVADAVIEDEFAYAAMPVDTARAFDPEHDRAVRTLVVLEQWLQAVHVSRADRHA